jgi:hypothetical protein
MAYGRDLLRLGDISGTLALVGRSRVVFDALRRPWHGPIPWSWWLPASRLPARSAQVGAVCWMLAGWSRSAVFELALDGWSDFGLSRFSAYRGLDTLEGVGLVSAVGRPGLSRIVTILDVTAATG